jgi:hypothetical protein
MSREPGSGSVLDHQSGRQRIFMVHLRLDADPARGQMAGRIQHVHSGDASHFETVEELVAFMTDRVSTKSG